MMLCFERLGSEMVLTGVSVYLCANLSYSRHKTWYGSVWFASDMIFESGYTYFCVGICEFPVAMTLMLFRWKLLGHSQGVRIHSDQVPVLPYSCMAEHRVRSREQFLFDMRFFSRVNLRWSQGDFQFTDYPWVAVQWILVYLSRNWNGLLQFYYR